MRLLSDFKNNKVVRRLMPARKEILASAIIVIVLSAFAILAFTNDSQNKLAEEPQQNVTVETTPEIQNGSQSNATLSSTINWKKQVESGSVDQIVNGTIVEQISPEQEYVYDSLELPEGWTATWSFDPIGTPENQRTYRTTPPNQQLGEKPTYIKISTGTKDTFKPSVVAPLGKPIRDTARDADKRPSGPIIHKKKIYSIMRSVKAADDENNNQPNLYTIDCYDIITTARCSGYPGYFSALAGPITDNPESLSINSGPKNLNTSHSFVAYLDDGKYGNEGRVYYPTQTGSSYGVGCVNVETAKNCGFTSLGTSNAQIPTGGKSTEFPTLITGFTEKDGKLYGHVNDMDLQKQKIICFDLNVNGQGGDAPCSGYDDTTVSGADKYVLDWHRSIYRAVGSQAISGNKLFYVVNYRHDFVIPSPITQAAVTQFDRRSVLFCFDLQTKQKCNGSIAGVGWAHGYGGAPVPGINLNNDHATNVFIWKRGGQDYAVCATIMYNQPTDPLAPFVTVPRCFKIDTGEFIPGGNDVGWPNFFLPAVRWPAYIPFVPWKVGENVFESTNQAGEPVTYFPLYSTRDGAIDSSIQNGATLCYNWTTQLPCEDFAYQLRYWFEIGDGQSGDVGYAHDGACMWASGNKNVLWSFDPRTGEFPCRSSQTEINISAGDNQYYCDGAQRAFAWDKLRLSKDTSLYNFHTFKVTVRNAETDQVLQINGQDTVDIKQNGVLNLASISYQQNPRLKLEVVPTVLNDTPWTGGKQPRVSAILNSENVQYCFETRPKEICNLKQVASIASTTVVTDTDTLTNSTQKPVGVTIPDNQQCYRDVKVSLSANRNELRSGENVTYTVKVEHKGTRFYQDATTRGKIENARIEATIPSNLEFVSANNGGTVQGNKVVWNSQTFLPADIKERQVTFRPKTATSQSSPANVVFAATTQQPLTVQASVIAGDDIFQSDNSASNNSVVLVTETSDDVGGGSDDETEEPQQPPIDDTPPELPEGTENTLEPGGPDTGGSVELAPPSVAGRTLTPSFLRGVVPPQFSSQAENFFKVVNSSIQPIPNTVAVAIPYATIAFLIAFAVIYIYQGIQEAKNRRSLVRVQKRYQRTEDLRRNYIDLTSHYLNTPIAKMQTTLEYLVGTKQLSQNAAEAAKQRLTRLSQHAKMLLGTAESTKEGKAASNKTKLNKRSSLFSPALVLPIVGVLLITVLINVLFVWADKYEASASSFIVQSSYYTLSVMALIIAYNRFKAQKYATEATQQEISLEKQLSQSQTSFITSSSKTLEDDLVELDQLAPTVANIQKGDGFINGLNSLKNAVSKLSYLNILTSHAVVPTLANQTIKDLANEVINDLKDYADERNITIDMVVESGLTALVDTDGFKQLLSSTVNNAIKFSKPNETVEIRISRHDGKSIKVVVKDNGVGIPKEKIDQLFEPFGRATDSREYNYEGFGLDLYMDKLIAEQCGGSIKVNSEVKKGTTVTIILPS